MITRQEQKIENTWKLEDIYSDDSQFEKEYELLEKELDHFQNYKGKLEQNRILLEALQAYETINYYFGRIYVYANQRNHQDATNSTYQNLSGKAQLMAVKVSQKTSWFEVEILKLNSIDSQELKKYHRFLEMIFRRKEHVLDEKTEALLARASDLSNTADSIYSMFNDADLQFEDCMDEMGNPHPLTHGNYISYMESNRPKNTIISQEKIGEEIVKNETIKIVLAKEYEYVKMPNIVGYDINDAIKILNNLNLEYRIVYFESIFDEDIVLYQEIESGSLIHKNNKSVIDIYVSKNTIN